MSEGIDGPDYDQMRTPEEIAESKRKEGNRTTIKQDLWDVVDRIIPENVGWVSQDKLDALRHAIAVLFPDV